MKTTFKLGKGLEALIPSSNTGEGATSTGVSELPISEIKANPYQPRTNFDQTALQTLSDSIKQHGLAQPILVRKKEGYYELIAGERRFRASIMAGLTRIPAIVKKISDKESLQLALIENLDREDLNPIDIAKGYQRLINEFQMTHNDIAQLFSRSRSAVTNTLRLLNLPEEIQLTISSGQLSEGHARTLLSIEGHEQKLAMMEEIIAQKLNVRAAEQMASRETIKPELQEKEGLVHERIGQQLSNILATDVKLKSRGKSGKIIIHFKNSEELQRLVQTLLKGQTVTIS